MKEHFTSQVWQPYWCYISCIQKNKGAFWFTLLKSTWNFQISPWKLVLDMWMRRKGRAQILSQLQHPYPASPFIKNQLPLALEHRGGLTLVQKEKSKFWVSLKIVGICLKCQESLPLTTPQTATQARLSSKKTKFLKNWPIEIGNRKQMFPKCGSPFNDQFHGSRRGRWETRSY